MSIAVFNTISILDPVFRRRQLDNSSTITGPDGRSYAANAGGQNHPAGTHTMGDGKLGSHQHHHEAYHHEQGHHMSGHLIHDGGLGAHVMQPDRAPPHHARQVTRCTTGRTPSMCQVSTISPTTWSTPMSSHPPHVNALDARWRVIIHAAPPRDNAQIVGGRQVQEGWHGLR